MLGLPGR